MQEGLRLEVDGVALPGDLSVPDPASGVVVFAHGSGSSRHSPRNRAVAQRLVTGGLGTLLVDLLTEEEEISEAQTRHLRFDIDLLAARLIAIAKVIAASEMTSTLPIGLFGASTGAAAALVAAAKEPSLVRSVVSRGGRPDLADEHLQDVKAPTLLIVGGSDVQVLAMNERARQRLVGAKSELFVIPGAGHLFEEPGALHQVAEQAEGWFKRTL